MASQPDRRAEITRLLATRESQGLTFKALAERSGIPLGTLSYWSHKLRREARREERPQSFIELQPAPAVEEDPETSHAAVRIEHSSGLTIDFTGDAALLATQHLVGRDRPEWS